MVINIRVNGLKIYKMEVVLIIMLMEIFIKVNGLMANLMDKAITSIMEIKVCIKAIGDKGGNKDLDNSLLMINMGILGNGERIRNMVKGNIFIQMARNMKAVG
jgi:hypothetical protein